MNTRPPTRSTDGTTALVNGSSRVMPCARRNLDDIAGAEIVDRNDPAERVSGAIDGGEPNQVGMIIFVRGGGRQPVARDIEFDAVEAFGLIAGGNALQRRDQVALRLAGMGDLELRTPSLLASGP